MSKLHKRLLSVLLAFAVTAGTVAVFPQQTDAIAVATAVKIATTGLTLLDNCALPFKKFIRA